MANTGNYNVDHHLQDHDTNVHYVWDNNLDPALTVSSGDVVQFECRDAVDGRLSIDATVDDLLAIDSFPGHPLTGPVAVKGAKPGDVLMVELLEFHHHGRGWSYFYPGSEGKGLLPEEFPDAGLHVWELNDNVGYFVNGIEVPLNPFPGNIGVAPAAPGEHSTTPPRRVGGNLDVKHLVAGSTLYLPIEVEGGLFSVGDCHAAQGDGEVCVTGIEAPMSTTARITVRSDFDIQQPQFETSGPFTPSGENEPMHATTGISDDLMDATKKSISHMINYLSKHRGLTRTEAYILCSVAVDLKISEVVDAPNWVVSAYLPLSIFPS